MFRLTVTGGGGVAATSTIRVRVAAGPKVEDVAFASQPTGGNNPLYAAGETIEVAVRFDREVTVDKSGGTPSVTLDVGGALRSALYLDGSGSRALNFGYVVQQTDTDSDGVDVVANSLALNGGEIAAVSDGGAAALGHEALAGGDGQTANGRGLPVTGGVCSRTPAVAAAIVERVRADEGNNGLTCDDITDPHLEAITGRLDLSAQVSAHGRMTALKAGDFADLTKVTALDLDNHALRSFPAGIFGPLTALTELSIAYNQTQAGDRLRSLPAGLFAGTGEPHDAAAGAQRPGDAAGWRLWSADRADSAPSARQQPIVAAGPHLPAADEPHDTDVPRQSRQRDVPARSGGRAGGRDRREGRGGGGVAGRGCQRSLGQQPGLFVGQGHGNDGGPVGDEYPDADLDRAGARGGVGAGVRTDGDRAGHEPDRDGQRDRAGRGGGPGDGGYPVLDADRRLDIQIGRDDPGDGSVFEAGDRDRHAAACAVGGGADPPGDLRAGHGHQAAGVRIHGAVERRRQRRHRDRGEQSDAPADGRRDRRCQWCGGDSQPYGAGGAERAQGGRDERLRWPAASAIARPRCGTSWWSGSGRRRATTRRDELLTGGHRQCIWRR